MAGTSKLQETEIPLGDSGGGPAYIRPVYRGRDRITLSLKGVTLSVSPEEAFTIGQSLVEHAVECGCDPDDGERRQEAAGA